MGVLDIFLKPADNEKPQQQQLQPQQVAPVVNTNPAVYSAPVNVNNVSPTVQPANNGDIDENIIRNIWSVLIEKNLPGPDFIEVKNCAASLESMGFSEQQRYEAAAKMLKSSYPNFTKDILLSSIDTYIQYVLDEKNVGQQQCEAKRIANVGDRKTRVEQLKQHGNEILAQIEKLQQEYATVNESINSLNNDIMVAEQQINNEETLFINSVDSIISGLNADKQLMASINM